MKSVLISIHPKWCELIAKGEKTLEVRKTRPKLETPFKVYIYCTADTIKHIVFDEYGDRKIELMQQRVIGEFICDAILPMSVKYSDPNSRVALKEFPGTCLSDKKIIDYLGNGVTGYAWHISDLKIYDNPKELSEFYVLCDRCDKQAIRCEYGYEENTENGYYSECMCDFKRPIKRPPQSWCYVEDL